MLSRELVICLEHDRENAVGCGHGELDNTDAGSAKYDPVPAKARGHRQLRGVDGGRRCRGSSRCRAAGDRACRGEPGGCVHRQRRQACLDLNRLCIRLRVEAAVPGRRLEHHAIPGATSEHLRPSDLAFGPPPRVGGQLPERLNTPRYTGGSITETSPGGLAVRPSPCPKTGGPPRALHTSRRPSAQPTY